MEFEWKILTGFKTSGMLEEIQNFITEWKSEPQQFEGRIIFRSMNNDINWNEQDNKEKCLRNSVAVSNYARRFRSGCWSFLGPGSEKKWYGTYTDKPDGKWDVTAEEMMIKFSESCHPIFRATSSLERGELRSKAREKKSVHFNGAPETIELFLRTMITVNQLNVYGAVPELCGEPSEDFLAWEKPDADEESDLEEIPTELPIADRSTDTQLQGNLKEDKPTK